MDCVYTDDCEEYTVRPMLGMTCATMKCCDEVPACFPCLPRCTQKPIRYCCEKPKPKAPPRTPAYCDLREHDCCHRRERSPRQRAEPEPEVCCVPPPRCEPYCPPPCKPVKTKYVIPCYRYEDGRIVRQLPVSAFKRNGMQDQEHSKIMGTTNFLKRCPRDVSIECEVCTKPLKVCDPAKVPLCDGKTTLGCCFLRKKPIEVSLEDILDDD